MTFEFDGKEYEKAAAHQTEWGARIVTELGLQGTERVLDLGCGDGRLTAQIADLAGEGEVVGIDASQSMIDAARPRERENLRFVLMDINNLSFAKQFDVVFSNATLHWVKDHKCLYRNVERALRPGGKIRFNFAGDGNCSHLFRVVRQIMAVDAFARYFDEFEWPWYMPRVDEYSVLVESSGLHSVRVWGQNADRFFENVEAMVKWIDHPSLVPFLANVPDGHKKAFRERVVMRMVEETKQEDGRCFETFRRINVLASK